MDPTAMPARVAVRALAGRIPKSCEQEFASGTGLSMEDSMGRGGPGPSPFALGSGDAADTLSPERNT